jgi:hypothetical protein
MMIKRYEIVPDGPLDRFRVIDKLKDDFVCVPLTGKSEEFLRAVMGEEDMAEEVDSSRVHPGYLPDREKEE